MKKCPICSRLYDESQTYCQDDGTQLVSDPDPSSSPTIVMPAKQRGLSPALLGAAFLTLLLVLVGVIVFGGISMFGNKSLQPEKPRADSAPVPTFTPSPTATPAVVSADNNNVNSEPVPTVPLNPANANVNVSVEPESNKQPDKPRPLTKPLKAIAKFFTFELLYCEEFGAMVTCMFNITNEGSDSNFALQPRSSLAVDDAGNQYRGSDLMTSELANVGQNNLLLVSKVPVKAKLMIEGVNPKAKKLALLDLKFCTQCGWGTDEVQFRQVPLFKTD